MLRTFLNVFIFSLAIGLTSFSNASVIAVIDSGVDRQHFSLNENIWTNPIDADFDGRDNDWNGYIDDVYGWNFFAQSPNIIDYKYIKLYEPDVLRFFEIQASALKGLASDEDIEWAKSKVSDTEFTKTLMTFGNFIHGTHVAGITLLNQSDSKILTIKLMPTENPLASLKQDVRAALKAEQKPNQIIENVIKGGLFIFAKIQASMFVKIGKYVAEHNVDVVNGSFGVGPMQANMIVSSLLKLANGGKDAPKESINELSRFLLQRINEEQKQMLNAAPKTLFVFAAGNDNSNNDILPTAPASINHPNRVSVAAVFEDGRLATFSNYGSNVDIAAPGVAINSAIPDDRQLELSGTSQASPLVAGVAAEIKNQNKALSPTEIKAVLLGTVDVKKELQGKVKSSGILNSKRAIFAAELSREMSLAEAIEKSNKEVADVTRTRANLKRTQSELPYFSVMPSFY